MNEDQTPEKQPVDLGQVVMQPVAEAPAPAKKRGRPSNAEKAAREATETAPEGAGTTDQEKSAPAADTQAPAAEENLEMPMSDGVPGEIPVLGVYLMNDGAQVPTPATAFSAGADVRANFAELTEIDVFTAANKTSAGGIRENFGVRSIVLQPGSRAKIPTGLIFDIPAGWKIAVHPRSGQSLKFGLNLANCVAVIDYDYTDQLYILVANTSQLRVEISHGDRIAQMSLERVYDYDVKVLSTPPGPKSERAGGVGSTGVK